MAEWLHDNVAKDLKYEPPFHTYSERDGVVKWLKEVSQQKISNFFRPPFIFLMFLLFSSPLSFALRYRNAFASMLLYLDLQFSTLIASLRPKESHRITCAFAPPVHSLPLLHPNTHITCFFFSPFSGIFLHLHH
jgi:hypothetical protein